MKPEAITAEKDTTISDAVTAAWKGAQSNAEAVAALMAMATTADTSALYDALTAPHLPRACEDAIGKRARRERSYIWTRPTAPDSRVTALADAHLTLFDIRLPGGKRLGDATREEVIEAGEYYHDAAAQMDAKARFYDAIAGKMKGKRPVSKQFNLADLDAIRDA